MLMVQMMSQPANSQPDKLRQVELSLLSNEQCKDKLVTAYKNSDHCMIQPYTIREQVGITDSMIMC